MAEPKPHEVLGQRERKRLEREAYRVTGKDHRTLFEGRPSVLVLGPAGTTLTPLASMTDAELVTYAQRKGVELRESSARARAMRCTACGHTAHHGSAGCEHVQGVNFCRCKLRGPLP